MRQTGDGAWFFLHNFSCSMWIIFEHFSICKPLLGVCYRCSCSGCWYQRTRQAEEPEPTFELEPGESCSFMFEWMNWSFIYRFILAKPISKRLTININYSGHIHGASLLFPSTFLPHFSIIIHNCAYWVPACNLRFLNTNIGTTFGDAPSILSSKQESAWILRTALA